MGSEEEDGLASSERPDGAPLSLPPPPSLPPLPPLSAASVPPSIQTDHPQAQTDAPKQDTGTETEALPPDRIVTSGEQIRAQLRRNRLQKEAEQRRKMDRRARGDEESSLSSLSSSSSDDEDQRPRLAAFPFLSRKPASPKSLSSPACPSSPSSSSLSLETASGRSAKPAEARPKRPQRQAAIRRPGMYDIDPIDDNSRLRKRPGGLEAYLASKPATKQEAKDGRKWDIQSLLDERAKERRRSGGGSRFAKADAIAEQLRQELEASAERELPKQEEHDRQDRGSSGPSFPDGDEGQASADVCEVSVYWSSDDSCSTCDSPVVGDETGEPRQPALGPKRDQSDMSLASCEKAKDHGRDAVMPMDRHRVLEDVLMSNADDDYESRTMLQILRQDLKSDPIGASGERAARPSDHRGQVRKPFWRSCRVRRPRVEDLCQLSLTSSSVNCAVSSCQKVEGGGDGQEEGGDNRSGSKPHHGNGSGDGDDALDGDTDVAALMQYMLAGALPLLFRTLPIEPTAICTWLFFQWILTRDGLVWQRSQEAFADIVQRHISDDEREAIIDRIAATLPKLFVLLGAKVATVQSCFSLDSFDLTAPPSVKRRSRSGAKVADDKSEAVPSKVDGGDLLLTADRWTILERLVQAIRIMSDSSRTQPGKHNGLAEGVFVSLLLIRCELQHGCLRDEVGTTLNMLLVEFSPFSVQNNDGGAELICSRIWGVLDRESLQGRLEVLRAFPADNYIARTIRRWLAWRSLMGEQAAGAHGELRYTVPDLNGLAALIQHDSPESPFYISPPSEDRKSDGQRTDYRRLGAATELLDIALSDVALQICKLKGIQDTPGRTELSPSKRKDLVMHARALDLALAPYKFLEPQRKSRRVEAMRNIAKRLKLVNGEILDTTDVTLERAKTKDALLRLYLSLDYQITMYEARPHKLDEPPLARGVVPSAADAARAVRMQQQREQQQAASADRASPATPMLIPGRARMPRFTTTPSFSGTRPSSPVEPQDPDLIGEASVESALSALPRKARPESPTKSRTRPSALGTVPSTFGALRFSTGPGSSPFTSTSKEGASEQGTETESRNGTRSPSKPVQDPTTVSEAALLTALRSNGVRAAERPPTSSSPPRTRSSTSAGSRTEPKGAAGTAGKRKRGQGAPSSDDRQRKLTSFFQPDERQVVVEVVVVPPDASSRAGLSSGHAAVMGSDVDDDDDDGGGRRNKKNGPRIYETGSESGIEYDRNWTPLQGKASRTEAVGSEPIGTRSSVSASSSPSRAKRLGSVGSPETVKTGAGAASGPLEPGSGPPSKGTGSGRRHPATPATDLDVASAARTTDGKATTPATEGSRRTRAVQMTPSPGAAGTVDLAGLTGPPLRRRGAEALGRKRKMERAPGTV